MGSKSVFTLVKKLEELLDELFLEYYYRFKYTVKFFVTEWGNFNLYKTNVNVCITGAEGVHRKKRRGVFLKYSMTSTVPYF